MNLTKDVVKGFVGSILSTGFDGAVESPEFHEDCWELCCSNNKFVAIAAPRSHAKSSGITLGYGLATLLFRERKFMLLVSDTESQAALFLGSFKQHLQDNQELIELFGLKRNAEGKVQFIKDTETDIIVEFEDGHKFRVIAKGAEQKLRGLLWNGSRPDIILCDDMENDELVMNKDRREKMRRWFTAALLPCRADNGVIRIVGTILHMDSLLERLMPSAISRYTRKDELKTWSTKKIGMWVSVKYKAHNEDFSVLLWPQKKSAEELMSIKEDYIMQGLPDVYSQEYLNVPLDEATAYFRRNDFVSETQEDRKARLNYYITADLAISENEKADYSVFVVAGMDENRILHIRNVIRARMDAREIVDTLMTLQKLYEPLAVGIEDMQVSKSIGPFLNEEMIKQGIFLNLIKLKHGGKDKLTRARSIQARMRAKGIRFDKDADWYSTFEEELIRFPRDRHDDQVDSFAYLGLMLDNFIEATTDKEKEEEEYYDELERSQLSHDGRSQYTGY